MRQVSRPQLMVQFPPRFPVAVAALALATALLAASAAPAQTHMHDHGAAPASPHAGHSAPVTTADPTPSHEAYQDQVHRMPVHLAMAPDANARDIARIGHNQYKRTTAAYDIPDVTLIDKSGAPVNLRALLADRDSPVLLNFIFTSCTTVCPVMSATFGHVQPDVTRIRPDYRMVSISIDPEYDTPSRLRDYASLHDAAPNWQFLTGDLVDVMRVVEAFDAVFRSKNKMYHKPLTYMRAEGAQEWVRLEGLLSAEELSGEYASLIAGHAH